MSDSDLEDLLRSADELVEQKEFRDDLRSADDLLCKFHKVEAATATAVPMVCWKKRDSQGNLIFARPRSTRNDSNQAGCSRNTDPPVDAPDPDCDLVFAPAIAPETVVRFVPVPDKICGCASESLSLKPGKTVTVITMNGRHELSMPELACEACAATWTTGVDDLLRSDYWPATLHFATIYATDTGKISTDSFIKSFFEWEAVRYEVDIMCKEEPFTCPACSPDMLAVSVDGNRKHYRFKNAARSPEEVFVEDSGRQPEDVTCKYWPYLQRVTKSCPELQHLLDMKPFLSVFHAKAHDFKCE
ncbi:hypothetical protein NQZ68_026396 [Dissostichus eleginoides]|nr:hypothetical protein NQZ68_026396 [Dissostichus eleginoides]